MRNSLSRQAGRSLAAVLMLLAFGPISAAADSRVEIAPFVGYMVGGRFVVQDGELTLDHGVAFGGALALRATPDFTFDVLYSRQSTTIQYETANFEPHEELFDITVQHINLGGTYEHGLGRVRPFFGGGLGLTRYEPDLADSESETRFSFNLATGIRSALSNTLGLRAGFRAWFTSPPDDGATIFRSESTDDFRQSGVSLINQYEFSLGLVFAL
jgi:opacity protein-like surface antigen